MLRKSLQDSCNNGPVTPSLRSPSLPSSPLLSPLPSSWWAPWDSRRQWQEGPTLSCERKPRNECHGLQGARLEWQQNNGGRYERHWTYSTHTHTHTALLQTHFYNQHRALPLFFLEQSYIRWGGGLSLRWVKFDIKWKHICEIYLRCCWECFRVSAAKIVSVHYLQDEQQPGCFFDYFHLSAGFIT